MLCDALTQHVASCLAFRQDALGDAYVLFLLEDKEGSPVAVVLPAQTVAAQELVLPQVRMTLAN